jgi:hypothetical protein
MPIVRSLYQSRNKTRSYYRKESAASPPRDERQQRICWIRDMILLCQDEMPGRIILMYLNKLLCTIQQKNYIVNCKLKVSSSNNNLLELQHLNSVDLFQYNKITPLSNIYSKQPLKADFQSSHKAPLIKINCLALWLDESAHACTRSELRGASCEDWKSALRHLFMR